MQPVQLVGRSSSHFTRVPRIFAHELGIPLELVPVYDVGARDPEIFGDNPALKIPVLRRGGSQVFGAENICRALVDLAPGRRLIVWPEQLRSDLSRNAQEFVWHAMAAQVQLIMGTMVSKLPASDPYFAKIRAGFEGALRWLDANLEAVLRALPERDVSLFEVTLFCLVEHLSFRGTLPIDPYPALVGFARAFGERPSSQATRYAFDTPPTPKS